MKIQELISFLESIAPPIYQEGYDNSGLLVGDSTKEIDNALICLDAVEEVIDEAIEKKCQLVIAHHPIIFGGLKRLNGKNYVERTLIKAIKNDIAIYAIHTNLDNVIHGVNRKIADKLGLTNLKILQPKPSTLKKLFTYIPVKDFEKVRDALFDAGAGNIGEYSNCSYSLDGTGTFQGSENSDPAIGEKENFTEVNERKLEVLFPIALERKVLNALQNAHPYEEVAYEIITLDNLNQEIGAGMYGELKIPENEEDFLKRLKETFHANGIRHTKLFGKKIAKVALCGGSGSFLLRAAKAVQADIFITGDFKYHEFFDAENDIIIADIGHYESEQYTSELLHEKIIQKFPNFAHSISGINTNPIKYFF